MHRAPSDWHEELARRRFRPALAPKVVLVSSANWPHPGLVTVRRPWDASPHSVDRGPAACREGCTTNTLDSAAHRGYSLLLLFFFINTVYPHCCSLYQAFKQPGYNRTHIVTMASPRTHPSPEPSFTCLGLTMRREDPHEAHRPAEDPASRSACRHERGRWP